jgi:hypothetical protein
MSLARGVGVLAGLNERTEGLLTGMALAMRTNLTGRRKRGMPVDIRRERRVSLRWRIGGDGIMRCRS